ncbi:MAG: DUF1343 domain-containing protein [bacterium]|nr:DUF1343 domain-containing protein [bacterium]
MDNQIVKFINLQDEVLHSGQLGLLCNQTSYDFINEKYLFETLAQRKKLKQVFLPEHGLFSELQDQVSLNATGVYKELAENVEFISLYQENENSLRINLIDLVNLDCLIIDIQDVGCRYFTYITTVFYIFETIAKNNLSISVYVIDRPNPAGRQVEGTLLPENFSSFVGVKDIPHRQGLTIGEMCKFFKDKVEGSFELKVIALDDEYKTFIIQPSPNISTKTTAELYSGQCLFEGTILSEGRGTVKPFEIIGAPFIEWNDLRKIKAAFESSCSSIKKLTCGIKLREMCFIPTFHKFKDETCRGFQLHLTGDKFHSLLYSMTLLKVLNETSDVNIWRPGKYEHGSDLTALEILVGDELFLNYIYGKEKLNSVIDKLKIQEDNWIKTANYYKIYNKNLFSIT